MDDAALVLFSGGQDSTVCLAWALGRYARVETIGFHYGQRHAVEMQCRTRVLHHQPDRVVFVHRPGGRIDHRQRRSGRLRYRRLPGDLAAGPDPGAGLS